MTDSSQISNSGDFLSDFEEVQKSRSRQSKWIIGLYIVGFIQVFLLVLGARLSTSEYRELSTFELLVYLTIFVIHTVVLWLFVKGTIAGWLFMVLLCSFLLGAALNLEFELISREKPGLNPGSLIVVPYIFNLVALLILLFYKPVQKDFRIYDVLLVFALIIGVIFFLLAFWGLK